MISGSPLNAFIRRLLPERAKVAGRRCANAVRHFGTQRICPVCRSSIRAFAPYGTPPEEEAVCPVCHSKAPHRLAAVFFLNHRHLFRSGATFLHIAPELELGRVLKKAAAQSGMNYRIGGITGTGESFLDVRNIGYETEGLHLIYCCHVLNMVDDDHTAIRELFRVLHPQGTAVLQVPAFYAGPQSLEPATERDRVQLFGDPTILRQYSNADFETRLRAAGFSVSAYRADRLSAEVVRRHSLKNELLHVCTKPMKL